MQPENEPLAYFTVSSLRLYDGESNRAYIAYKGKVYDVTDCPKWRDGMHEFLHFPGQDLTEELADAPHSEEVLKHPCVNHIGYLVH